MEENVLPVMIVLKESDTAIQSFFVPDSVELPEKLFCS